MGESIQIRTWQEVTQNEELQGGGTKLDGVPLQNHADIPSTVLFTAESWDSNVMK